MQGRRLDEGQAVQLLRGPLFGHMGSLHIQVRIGQVRPANYCVPIYHCIYHLGLIQFDLNGFWVPRHSSNEHRVARNSVPSHWGP